MRAKKTRTASDLLTIWGLLYASGSLKDILKKKGTGEEGGLDEEQLAADYVARTQGYFRALPVLRFCYVHCHPLSELPSFDPCMPGERLEDALKRHGWQDLLGVCRREVGPVIHQEFLNRLIDRTRSEPFYYHEEVREVVLPLRRQFA